MTNVHEEREGVNDNGEVRNHLKRPFPVDHSTNGGNGTDDGDADDVTEQRLSRREA